MSTFLDDLEHELRAAHPRRRSARRRATAGRLAHAAPLALVVLLTLAGAGAFVLSVRGEDAARPVTTSPEPPAVWAAELPAEGVAVLNGTTVEGLGRKVADLVGAGGAARARDEVGNAPPPQVRRTRVAYAEGHEEAARRVAFRLGVTARPLDADLRAASPPGAALVVVAGRDLLRVRSGTLRPPAEGGAVRGNAGIVERAGGRAVVSVDAIIAPGSHYAIWLLSERGTATLLGFAAEPVRAQQRRLHGTREIRTPSGARKIIVTRETNPQPRRPARPLLEATLR